MALNGFRRAKVHTVRRDCLASHGNLLDRIQDANKLDQWAMTDADIAIYDKAFSKQDKDKDGFISPHGDGCVPN